MSADSSSQFQSSSAAAAEAEAASRPSVAEIDASCRVPLLFLFGKALGWLVLGLLFALIASIKMHVPSFIADCPWFTYGRVRPAAINLLAYGFASQAALGVILWLFARLGATRLAYQLPILIGAVLWNVGVFIGVVGILAGGSTGFELLEMPREASPVLFVAYAIIAGCALLNFTHRNEKNLYVSHWFLLAALFWFPWIYSAANMLLVFTPVRGTLQATVAAWYANDFLGLWLLSIGLALVFYFIPKLAGRPLEGTGFAAFGFWTYALFMNLAGLAPLLGGPLPLWLTSASTMAAASLLLPAFCFGTSWYLTLREDCAPVRAHPAGRFILGAAVSFLAAIFLQSLLACPKVAVYTQFTLAIPGRSHLALLGGVVLALLGAIQFIVPRVTGVDWACPKLGRMHFILSAVGVALVALPLVLAGFVQGSRMQNVAVAWNDIARSVVPLIGLSTLGWLVLLAGQALLVFNLCGLLRQFIEPFRQCSMALVSDHARAPEPSGAGVKA